MSYILEALKRSEQARERGQVPRLQTPLAPPSAALSGPRYWHWLALGLTVLVAGLSLFLLLRPGAPATAPHTPAVPLATPTAAMAARPPLVPGGGAAGAVIDPLPADDQPLAPGRAGPTSPNGARPTPPPVASLATPPAGPAPAAPPPATAADQPPTADPAPAAQPAPATPAVAATATPAAGPSPAPALAPAPAVAPAAPQVLVVPAPPKPGQSLPRGADELRRAVLGPDAALEPPVVTAPLPEPPPLRAPTSGPAPIPPDLIAEIQAFKRQVGQQPAGPGKGKATPPPDRLALPPIPAPAPPAAPQPPTRPPARSPADPAAGADTVVAVAPPPSAALQRRLPAFKINVHVFNPDRDQRFVYINGSKLREHEATRDGLRVEQVREDGVVLSFEGERFFQPR